MTTIEAARIINAIKCSTVTTLEEHEALTMAELVLFEQIDELVRCKDCKWHGRCNIELTVCMNVGEFNGFCALAKRRDKVGE